MEKKATITDGAVAPAVVVEPSLLPVCSLLAALVRRQQVVDGEEVLVAELPRHVVQLDDPGITIVFFV